MVKDLTLPMISGLVFELFQLAIWFASHKRFGGTLTCHILTGGLLRVSSMIHAHDTTICLKDEHTHSTYLQLLQRRDPGH